MFASENVLDNPLSWMKILVNKLRFYIKENIKKDLEINELNK